MFCNTISDSNVEEKGVSILCNYLAIYYNALYYLYKKQASKRFEPRWSLAHTYFFLRVA